MIKQLAADNYDKDKTAELFYIFGPGYPAGYFRAFIFNNRRHDLNFYYPPKFYSEKRRMLELEKKRIRRQKRFFIFWMGLVTSFFLIHVIIMVVRYFK